MLKLSVCNLNRLVASMLETLILPISKPIKFYTNLEELKYLELASHHSHVSSQDLKLETIKQSFLIYRIKRLLGFISKIYDLNMLIYQYYRISSLTINIKKWKSINALYYSLHPYLLSIFWGTWSSMIGFTFKFKFGKSGSSCILLDTCLGSWLVWYDLLLLWVEASSKVDTLLFNLVIYAFCFSIRTIAYLYFALYCYSLSRTSCCTPIGSSYYC